MTDREFHPVAGLFPMLDDVRLDELAADIKAHGLREPVVIDRDGRVVDGRNRLAACRRAGVEPTWRTYDGDDAGLLDYVLSLNLHRRHLDEGQRAMVAARIADLEHGQKKADRPIGLSQPEAAELLNVGERSVKRAKQVIERGAPELVAAVEQGRVAVSAAAEVAALPKAAQKKIAAQGPKAVKTKAAELRAAKAGKPRAGGRRKPTPPAEVAPRRLPREMQPDYVRALSFANHIGRIKQLAHQLEDRDAFLREFPPELVKDLDISLRSAAEFLLDLADRRRAAGVERTIVPIRVSDLTTEGAA